MLFNYRVSTLTISPAHPGGPSDCFHLNVVTKLLSDHEAHCSAGGEMVDMMLCD